MKVKDVFSKLDTGKLREYDQYWQSITPTTNADVFRRWLFAFCSVHTTWEGNVRGYEAIKDLGWLGDREELRRRLLWSGCGLYNNRARFITEFSAEFWSDPAKFWPASGESWRQLRDRLESSTIGLGLAKTSFALEMSHPGDAQVVCLDVHMLRLYTDKPSTITPIKYAAYEADWLGRSHAIGHPPYVTRMAWWDARQGKNDSRYWSHCLE